MMALIVGVFILGYLLIAFESVTKISKTAVAMLMCVVCWILYSLSFGINSESFVHSRSRGYLRRIQFRKTQAAFQKQKGTFMENNLLYLFSLRGIG